MLSFDELRELREKLNGITITGLEDVKLGNVMSEFIYVSINRESGGRKEEPAFKHLVMIFLRSIVKSNVLRTYGKGRVLCFIPRNMLTIQNNHLGYYYSVVKLIPDRIEMVGCRKRKVDFSNLGSLKYLFAWNKELKGVFKDKKYRWYFIRALFGAVVDAKDYERYVKKTGANTEGLLLYVESPAPTQILRQRLEKRGVQTVCMSHGVNPASELIEYIREIWGCSYYLVQSRMEIDNLDMIGGFPGRAHPVGINLYIDKEIQIRNKVNKVKIIVVFLDGLTEREDLNIELIKIAMAIKDAEIIVKFHPTTSTEYMERVISETKEGNIISYYKNEVPLIDIFEKMDLGVCWNSSIYPETISEGIPSVIYKKNQVTYKYLKEDVFFADESDFIRQVKRVENGGFYNSLAKIREYMCGPSHVKEEYAKFFYIIGWRDRGNV